MNTLHREAVAAAAVPAAAADVVAVASSDPTADVPVAAAAAMSDSTEPHGSGTRLLNTLYSEAVAAASDPCSPIRRIHVRPRWRCCSR